MWRSGRSRCVVGELGSGCEKGSLFARVCEERGARVPERCERRELGLQEECMKGKQPGRG